MSAGISCELDTEKTEDFHSILLYRSIGHLQNLAFQARNEYGWLGNQVVVLFVEIFSRWRPLIDVLNAGMNNKVSVSTSVTPIFFTTIDFELCSMLADMLPDSRERLLCIPDEGLYKLIALNNEGCSIYEIAPKKS